jgi:hypothetical protein
MKEGNQNRIEREETTMKHLSKVQRTKVANKAAKTRQSNALYVKRATAALDAWETIREDRAA